MASKWIHVESARCLLCRSRTLWVKQYANGTEAVQCRNCEARWEAPSYGEALYAAGCHKLHKLEDTPLPGPKNRQRAILSNVTA